MRAARQHFVDTFGKPTKALAFGQAASAGGLRTVEVGAFGETPAPHVLATAGASSIACADGARREWVLILKEPPPDGLFSFLADVAAAGGAVGSLLTTDALAPFSAVLLLDARALPAQGRAIERKDGVAVEVGWVIPVFPEEARFAAAEGADALFSHWEQKRPDLTDLRRKVSAPSA